MALRLGYVSKGEFPFIFDRGVTGKKSGIYIAMWSFAARRFGLRLEFQRGDEYGGYTVENSTGYFSGVVGWLQNETIDDFSRSLTTSSSLLRISHLTSSNVGIIYNALFAGLALTNSPFPPTTISQLTNQLQHGSRTLLARSETFFKPETITELFGADIDAKTSPNRFREIPEFQDQIILMCSSDRFVGFAKLFERFANRLHSGLKFPCQIQTIDTSNYPFPVSSEMGQDAYGRFSPVTFYYGKHLGYKFRSWFDQVILRVFGEEQMTGFWWRRYANRPRSETEIPPIHTYTSLPISAFESPFFVCAGLIVLSIVVFFLELANHKFCFHRRFYRMFIAKLRAGNY